MFEEDVDLSKAHNEVEEHAVPPRSDPAAQPGSAVPERKAQPCSYCGQVVAIARGCEACHDRICEDCLPEAFQCTVCYGHLCPSCSDHHLVCLRCGAMPCKFCAATCCLCGRAFCRNCFDDHGGSADAAINVCGHCIGTGLTVSATIPINAFLGADGTSPNPVSDAWPQLLAADAILTDDAGSLAADRSQPIRLFGLDAIEQIVSGLAKPRRLLVISVDYRSDDLQRLAALVRQVRGRVDIEPSADMDQVQTAQILRAHLLGSHSPTAPAIISRMAVELLRRVGQWQEQDVNLADLGGYVLEPVRWHSEDAAWPNSSSEVRQRLAESKVVVLQDTRNRWEAFVHGQKWLAQSGGAHPDVLIVRLPFGYHTLVAVLSLLRDLKGLDDFSASLLEAAMEAP